MDDITRYGSPDVGFALFGGYSILGTITDIDLEKEAVLEDGTVLGDADEVWNSVGLRRGALKQTGFFDDAANSVNDMLVGLAQRVAAIGLEGNTFGKRFVGWAGTITSKYRRIASKAAMHKAEGDHQVTGRVDEGIILATHAARSGTAVGSSHDNAASSANGAAGYVNLSALTLGGYTSLTVKLRHSTDNTSFTDLITFTAITAAPAAEQKTVAGTINRYTREERVWNGAGTGESATYMAGIARGGQDGNLNL